MATATRRPVQLMARYDAQSIRRQMAEARAQGATAIEWASDTMHVVGGSSDVALRRKVGCRVCGEPMPKGATATQFAYRFDPDIHPYRITEAFIHPERCRPSEGG